MKHVLSAPGILSLAKQLVIPVDLIDRIEVHLDLASGSDSNSDSDLQHEVPSPPRFLQNIRPLSCEVNFYDIGGQTVPTISGLVTKAIELFHQHIRELPDLTVSIFREAPFHLGLNVESADAAAVLSFLREAYAQSFPWKNLCQLAREISADVPFFLNHAKAGYRERREGPLIPLDFNDSLFALILAFEAKTPAWVFNSNPASHDLHWDLDLKQPLTLQTIIKNLHNQLEKEWEASQPEIRVWRQALQDAGALTTCTINGGSALFGLFTRLDQAHEAQRRLLTVAPNRFRLFVCRSLT